METRLPLTFHVMAKPAGARCNLGCSYCFYRKKAALYPGSIASMDERTAQQFIEQAIAGQAVPSLSYAWQGGEPTLMGLEFFRRMLQAERAALPVGWRVERSLQTNGVLLDDEWAAFLAENDVLVGLSLDGPRHLHDAYRRDAIGRPTFDTVIAAASLLQRHGAQFNILCTVNSANVSHPLDVYRFLRDELGARYVQFIPIVEAAAELPAPGRPGNVTAESVEGLAYGEFLTAIFDEWVRNDVGTTFVQFFDAVLSAYAIGRSSLCVLQPTCGTAVALEHNGDVYSCDHFVDSEHLLGNITSTPLGELVRSDMQRAFGESKSELLPLYCRECDYLRVCNGECPKNRILLTPAGEPGLNWLCSGLRHFFAHTERHMRTMATLLAAGHDASDIMESSMPPAE